MKKILFFIAIIALWSCSHQEKTSGEKFELGTGVNISHWLSQSKKRGAEREAYIQKSDFDSIAAVGFDHVRICVDEEQLWDSLGNQQAEAFQLLHNAINWSLNDGLNVIVDLHIIRSHYFNAKDNSLWTDTEAQKWLYEMWRQLSEELHQYPTNRLAYELMNEAVAENTEDWNRLINHLITELRTIEPERVIVVGSNRWQQAATIPELKLPPNDTNIILSFHFYNPMALTHHQAWWMPLGEYKGPVNYPGQIIDPKDYQDANEALKEEIASFNGVYTIDSLEKMMMPAILNAKERGLPLYCGEFGVYQSVEDSLANIWYRDMIQLFNKHGIARCHWCYKGDFPVVDYSSGNLKRPLVEILSDIQ